MANAHPERAGRLLEASNSRLAVFALIRDLSKPVLASVNGMAMGGGCGLAMCCDLVIASDAAEFAYPEVRRGLVPGTVIAWVVSGALKIPSVNCCAACRRWARMAAIPAESASRIWSSMRPPSGRYSKRWREAS